MNTSYDPLYLFIGGEWISAEGRATAAVVNPATAREIGRVPLATTDDLNHALEVAQLSFEQWRQTVPDKRAKILKRAADLILERAPHIAEQMTLEEGKPLAESLDEVTRAAEYFEWFAESARRIDGRVVPANRPGVLQLVKRQAIGPVAAFTPLEFPSHYARSQALGSLGRRLQCHPQARGRKPLHGAGPGACTRRCRLA